MRKNIIKHFGDSVYIISDYDGDGFSSAWIVYNFLRKLGKNVKIRFYIRSSGKNENLVALLDRILLDTRYNSVIVLDTPFDKNIDNKRINKTIVWIDHHLVDKKPKNKKIIFINPRLVKKDAYVPTSCLIFRMFKNSEYFDEKMLFMSALGTLSDIGLRDCLDLYEEFSAVYPNFFDPKKIDEYEKTKLFKYVKLMNSALMLNITNARLNSLLRKIKNPIRDIVSENFKKYQRIVDREVKKELERFKKYKIKISDNILLYIVSTKLPIKTIIAYRLAKKYRKKIILVGQKIYGNRISISARRGKLVKENLVDILSELVDFLGIEKYGGHPNAAGAIINVRKAKLKL